MFILTTTSDDMSDSYKGRLKVIKTPPPPPHTHVVLSFCQTGNIVWSEWLEIVWIIMIAMIIVSSDGVFLSSPASSSSPNSSAPP